MKPVIVAAPALVVALVLLALALAGRPVSRRGLNVIAALVLFAYVTATAALGVFWVSRMDLPAFDWHYLAGYALMVLVAVHFGLQLRGLVSFVRSRSPSGLLSSDRRRFRPVVRAAAWAALSLVLLTPLLVWWAGARGRAHGRVAPASSIAAAEPGAKVAEREEIWIERDGRRVGVVDYLWEQSSLSRSGVMRSPALAPPKQREVRDSPKAAFVPLPKPRARANVPLGKLSEPARPEAGRDRIVVGRGAAAGAASLEHVSELLQMSYGVTSRHAEASGLLFRATASSGALYPIDLFLSAPSVAGLGSGLHYYHPHRHALVALPEAEARERIEEALPPDSRARGASLLLVLGATFDRTRIKYDTRSYRYVGLDAGHLAKNALAAGGALGLACSLEPFFDDEALARSLGLADDGEGVMLVVACELAGRARLPRPKQSLVAHSLVQLPEHADDVELTRLSHRLTSYRLRPPSGPSELAELPPPAVPGGRSFELALAAPSEADVFEVITRRRSVRDYADAAVPLAGVSALLESARLAAGALERERLVDVYVFARRVAEIPAGVYLHDGERRRLILLGEGDVSRRVESAGLSQELLGDAALVVGFALKPALVGRVDGARDFRHALIEAGLAGEALYLEATARGLGACGVGAFYDAELGELAVREGAPPRFVHLTAVGPLD